MRAILLTMQEPNVLPMGMLFRNGWRPSHRILASKGQKREALSSARTFRSASTVTALGPLVALLALC